VLGLEEAITAPYQEEGLRRLAPARFRELLGGDEVAADIAEAMERYTDELVTRTPERLPRSPAPGASRRRHSLPTGYRTRPGPSDIQTAAGARPSRHREVSAESSLSGEKREDD
jgi:hypothetical protein